MALLSVSVILLSFTPHTLKLVKTSLHQGILHGKDQAPRNSSALIGQFGVMPTSGKEGHVMPSDPKRLFVHIHYKISSCKTNHNIFWASHVFKNGSYDTVWTIWSNIYLLTVKVTKSHIRIFFMSFMPSKDTLSCIIYEILSVHMLVEHLSLDWMSSHVRTPHSLMKSTTKQRTPKSSKSVSLFRCFFT